MLHYIDHSSKHFLKRAWKKIKVVTKVRWWIKDDKEFQAWM